MSNLPIETAARLRDVVKLYGAGDTLVRALDGVTYDFRTGSFTAIMGPSGSGKSTLLHCLAALEPVTSGTVELGGHLATGMRDHDLTLLRRRTVGFVFQTFNLVPTLTLRENVLLPLDLAGERVDEDWLTTVLGRLDLENRLRHRPAELSGGQQQRAAVARALITRPAIVFADEPTGNLDTRSGHELLATLRDAVSTFGQTVVMVTHDAAAATTADEVVMLVDGRIVNTIVDPTTDSILRNISDLTSGPVTVGTP